MKWVSEDIDMYLKSKEYVDTIVLPLYPISFGEEMMKSADMTEFISLVAVQLERQFKGRIILLPGFTYIKKENVDESFNQLLQWEKELLEKDFKHVFYLTSDSDWKLQEESLSGDLIWLPTIPMQSMDQQYRNTILEDQVKQMLKIFIQKWQKIE